MDIRRRADSEKRIVQAVGKISIQESLASKKKDMYVRGLSSNVKSGLETYRSALKECQAEMRRLRPVEGSGLRCSSWMYQVPYFRELSENVVRVSKEERELCRTQVDEYLDQLGARFTNVDHQYTTKLESMLQEMNADWELEHGEVPPKVSILKRYVFSNEKNEPVEQAAQEEKRLKLINLRVEYDNKVAAIRSLQGPKVYTLPGTPGWKELGEYFHLLQARNTILFSVDIEAYELAGSVITEVGFAIYDPRENQNLLSPEFRSFHLCPSESLGLVNEKYVPNHKSMFLMGETLVMPLAQCIEFIQGLVNYYLVPKPDIDDSYDRAIVGHDVQSDLHWLKGMFVDLPHVTGIHSDDKNCVKILDTSHLYKRLYGLKGCSLGKALRLHGIPHSYLHNAGNDAHYTLQLLMNMGDVQRRVQRGWDDLYAVHHTLQHWEELDALLSTSPNVSAISPESKSTGTKVKRTRTSRAIRNWDTHLSGMVYHENLQTFIQSIYVPESSCI
ncbi:Gfd2p Ecym_1042 [Eremothecium cymbalariae DBVPG|uniref:Gfd2/YDR514C-like C-terminal domain-containing protein n=1 Tax=Eremothecium cymbalariae (strain CBS 270.75 / DBVPG 7215 / KCTC 17166 / NRRL Y-17582) TaxID=931890 RepID=G8JM40_ERECY|nr:hypothetical protein Ecym_1042 [Eremothecium cymbalariae DBVPG\